MRISSYKNAFISLGFFSIIGLAAWTTLLSTHPHTTTLAQNIIAPDAVMEGVTAIFIDKQGKPTMRVETPKLVHFNENNATDFTDPKLTLYRKSPEPWYVTAKNARAIDGIEHVNFEHDVVIHHAADLHNPATVIKTDTLTVFPDKQIAETSDPITLVQPSVVVKATGMHADMMTGDIKLLSEARGEYVPSS
jgi:lipopolysaccharide export system protein LptC